MNTLPLTRDLVLIGGGHAHALVLKKWGMAPLPGVRLTVIDPAPEAAYSGMLPGFVAGHYTREQLNIDLVRLARFAGARLILGAAQGIDLTARRIHVPGRPPVAFDVAAIDVGITSAMPALPGFAAHGIPAKPLTPFAARWDAYQATAEAPRVAVIGGGVAGVELILAMAHALRGRGAGLRLIDRGPILKEMNPDARRLLRAELAAHGVEVLEGVEVAQVTAEAVVLADGREVAATFTVGAAGARPHDWLAHAGLTLHEGFVAVSATLQSSDPAILASGDCAHMTAAPRPKAGVYAVRQAPVLFDNLRALLSGGSLRPYRPQSDYLKLVSLGGKRALAEKWGTARKGALLWRWKDRIDRRFMDGLSDLPAMAAPAVPVPAALGMTEALGGAPMCAGCGAKVGRGALGAALAALPPPGDDVESLPGDDAAILRTGGARQVLTTDHLRAVVADPVLMTRIAAIHALGDIWAMGARPQAALASLILPRMTAELQRRTLAEMMAAAEAVFAEAGAPIVGGHSSMGAEMTVGFTVTGLCDAPPITLAGARPGDALVLTKALGTGVVLAAEMQGRARGTDVAACLAAMTVPQGAAAEILAPAHAMTDVTGFGLAGHLAGICTASDAAAEIDLAGLPLLPGAADLTGAGVRSTLWADNRDGAGPVFGAAGPVGDLLFDPQTCGGLLAAVPGDGAAEVAALHGAGFPAAAVIGRIVAGDPAITCR